ncbi:MAG: ATP12 family protein [Pseudomonadota bacterium]
MSGWAAKRFWREVHVAPVEGGFEILLDDKPVRTPAKAPLQLPTKALAGDVAAEWEAQDDIVRPELMPVTRMANSAIDKVRPQRTEIVDMLAGYGETDLLCYRAEAPDALVARQQAAWDPLLDWLTTTHGVRLRVTGGILPVAQDRTALAQLAGEIERFGPFELAAFHDLVTLPGSLVLGFAATARYASLEALWEAARLDEAWQIEQWGEDDKAEEANRLKRDAFLQAHRFFERAR